MKTKTDITKEEVINTIIANGCDTNKISDGFHTFEQLYEHRIVLYMVICDLIDYGRVWKSKKHSDGTEWDGWFLLGIDDRKGKQITYHLPISKWDQCNFQELKQAPEYDGHTSEDVLNRLKVL